MDKDPLVLFNHIFDAVSRIEVFLKDVSWEDFEKENSMVFSAVIRELEVVGEAACHIPEEFRIKHNDIPWVQIIGMRNHLIHGYFQVNKKQVWKVVTEDMPKFKNFIRSVLIGSDISSSPQMSA